MRREQCPHAYRDKRKKGVQCRLMDGREMTQCGHQYFCHQSQRWEATKDAALCPLRQLR